jgi:filamentous hemagglutinin
VSAGTINVTDGANQKQDAASLSRDTNNTNGTVSKTPDVQNILSQQADTMQAAQAAGQAVAQGIGEYADRKRDSALDAAEKALKSGDLDGARAALADYQNWKEGGDSRAALQTAGGAVIGGLGGGSALSALGGAVGAGASSLLAGRTKDVSTAVADGTGSSLLGNISGNILAGLGGALIGGSAGAAMASNVSLYNQGNDTGEQSASERAADLATRLANAVVQTAAHPVDSLNYALGGIFRAPGASGPATDSDVLTGESRSTSPLSQSRTDLMLQGIRNGLSGILFGEGGGPQSPNPGTVAVTESGAAQAGRSAPVNVAGYGPGNATLSSGNNGGANENGADTSGGSTDQATAGGATTKGTNVKSPNDAMRSNANATGTYVDPLTGQTVSTAGTLAADHIVPQSWIKAQPGFDQLTPEQQGVLLNDPANTQGLPTTFNSSKGAKMPGDWQTYKGEPLDPGYIQDGAQQAERLRGYITDRIRSMLGR